LASDGATPRSVADVLSTENSLTLRRLNCLETCLSQYIVAGISGKHLTARTPVVAPAGAFVDQCAVETAVSIAAYPSVRTGSVRRCGRNPQCENRSERQKDQSQFQVFHKRFLREMKWAGL
jgi:hypothetical protein